MNCQPLAPVWNISDPPSGVDLSTESYDWHEVKETHEDVSNLTQYRLYTTDKEAFWLPASAHLQVTFQVKDNGGSALAVTDYTSLVGDALACFENMRLRFDNNEIAQLDKPAKSHVMRALVEYTKEYAETIGQNQYFYPDSASDQAAVTSVAPTVNRTAVAGTTDLSAESGADLYKPQGMYHEHQILFTAANPTAVSGLIRSNPNFSKEHKIRVDSSTGTVTAMIPLACVFPIMGEWDRVFKGTRIEVEATKVNSVSEATFGAVASEPTLSVSGISMWIARLKPSLPILSDIEKTLVSQSQARFKYNHMELYHKDNIEKTTLSQSYRVASEHARPTLLVVGFQDTNRSTNHKLNTLQFDRVNVSKIHVRLNGHQYPLEEYAPGDDHSRVLADIYRVGCKQGDEGSSALVTNSNWSSLYPIYVFDLQYQPESSFKSKQIAEVELRWTLSSAPTNNYDVQCLLFSEREIEFDYKMGSMKTRRL